MSARIGLSAHLTAVQSGTFLIAMALLWPHIGFPEVWRSMIAHGLWVSLYAIWLSLFLAGRVGANGALAVGGYITLAGFWAAPVSGVSMNPFRSLGPDHVRGDLSTSWIYVAGSLIGAMIAVGFEMILKGSPTAAGAATAQGELKE